MTTVILVYNDDTIKFYNQLVELNKNHKFRFESYNLSYHKDKKKGYGICTNNGVIKLPFVMFEDENQEQISQLWIGDTTGELTNKQILDVI